MLRAVGSKANLLDSENTEYYSLVADLINHEKVLQMKQYIQHGNTSCFQHCLNVSYYNYLLCKFFSLNTRAAARAGLLHDLFLYDWHTYKKPRGEKFHGFTHPKAAALNADRYFSITDIERDIIEKHMFPLTISLPRHKETVVIILVDKYCGLIETVAFRVRLAEHQARKLKRMITKLFFKKVQPDIE
jgi:uncharacterized protein